MNGNGKMSGNSWFSLECLVGIVVIGLCCVWRAPAYPIAVYAVLQALIQALGNSQGVKSGSALPQQANGSQQVNDSRLDQLSGGTHGAPSAGGTI